MKNTHFQIMSNISGPLIYQPLVSIVTPVLNGVKYLEFCIHSVLNQSYSRIEHIFVDGGSTDGTLDVLAHFSRQSPEKIRVINNKDAGIGGAVNDGYRNAKGHIFSWLDSDDIYSPDVIKYVVDFFELHRDAYFLFGGCDLIDADGGVIGKRSVKDFNKLEAIMDRHYIYLPAVFYRREVFEKAGPFNTLGNDLDFYLRVSDIFPLHRTTKTLAKWRRHAGSITNSKKAGDRATDRQRFRQDYDICRNRGGSIFAPRVKRYIAFIILDKMGIYVFVNSVIIPGLRRIPFVRGVLKIFGA